ncbi:hypothetical protein LUZ60_015975 [Juncus effusus]|nr:hypothetical protein LUZ60_015975 [Juncus effusus]
MEEGKAAIGMASWSMIRAILAIVQWWGFNVTVIIMNKWIFQKLDFKFPLTVSCVHFICSSIGAYLAIKVLKMKPLIEVETEDRWRRIFPMSFVFCINIVLGNVSLRYIPVSFMQTIKSFTPATTVILQWLVWRKQFEWRIWASLVPIVGGILLTSITELSFNAFGFCAALFGCLATSTKTILAESLLHGYKFDSINTVYYMAPFATAILAIPAILLEGSGVMNWFFTHETIMSSLFIILTSGVLAFCLNFSIFYVIHSTTAVTFNVAGNLKVAVAVLVSWMIFRNPISPMNAIGCGITLVGCTFYGYVRHLLSSQQSKSGSVVTPTTPKTPRTPRSLMEMHPLVGSDKQDDKGGVVVLFLFFLLAFVIAMYNFVFGFGMIVVSIIVAFLLVLHQRHPLRSSWPTRPSAAHFSMRFGSDKLIGYGMLELIDVGSFGSVGFDTSVLPKFLLADLVKPG